MLLFNRFLLGLVILYHILKNTTTANVYSKDWVYYNLTTNQTNWYTIKQ